MFKMCSAIDTTKIITKCILLNKRVMVLGFWFIWCSFMNFTEYSRAELYITMLHNASLPVLMFSCADVLLPRTLPQLI